MRRCDLATGAGRIRHALEHLETVWNESSDRVERRGEPAISRAASGADDSAAEIGAGRDSRMSLLMDEVERDCES